MRPARVGLILDIRNPPQWRRDWRSLYDWTLEVVSSADARGLGAVWLSEHHLFEDGYLPQPFLMAAAIAERTTNARIGTAVAIAPFYQAIRLAESASIIDVLSGGRFELGLGAGYRVPEFEAHGVLRKARYTVTDAAVTEVRRLISTGDVLPPPIQPSIPIWLGYQGARGARRAGRLNTGLMSLRPELLEPYVAGLAEGGHDLTDARMGGFVNIFLADDPEAAWSELRTHVAYQWDSYNRYEVEGTTTRPPQPVDPDRLRMRRSGEEPFFEILTPEEALRSLHRRLGGLPVTDVFFWANVAGAPTHLAERHIELLLEVVQRGVTSVK